MGLSNTAEGFWSGSTSDGLSISLLILENGQTWGFYRAGANLRGLVQGETTGSGRQFSSAFIDFNADASARVPGTADGTVVPAPASMRFSAMASG